MRAEDRSEFDPDAAAASDDSPRDRFVRRVVVGHIATFAVVFAALVYGVPRFERVLKDYDARLPKITQGILNISNWFGDYWYVALAMWIAGICGVVAFDYGGHRESARTVSRLWVVGVLLFFVLLVVAMFLPLVELIQKLS